jgi:hypothetical protein
MCVRVASLQPRRAARPGRTHAADATPTAPQMAEAEDDDLLAVRQRARTRRLRR